MIRHCVSLITATIILNACSPIGSGENIPASNTIESNIDSAKPAPGLNTLFTKGEAEKILGEAAFLKDSSSATSKTYSVYKCSYAASAKTTDRIGAVYFMAEHYLNIKAADQKYRTIYNDNKDHKGIKPLQDMGDEAYFHTDEQNFYFILCRKGGTLIRMKVNKITDKTSLAAFTQIAADICSRL